MKKRSASADNICAVAVVHFSEHGYDASSLSDIAEQAGMRKASLYSHFAGKDALFLDVFADALAEEQAFMDACFADEAAAGGARRPAGRRPVLRMPTWARWSRKRTTWTCPSASCS